MLLSNSLKEILQACNDAFYINFDEVWTNDDYSFLHKSLVKFANALPKQERDEIVNDYGAPTVMANSRLLSAVLLRGYRNSDLILQANLYQHPDARMLLNVLAAVAPNMESLAYLSDGLDIRDILSEAVIGLIEKLGDPIDLRFLRRNFDDLDYFFIDDFCGKEVIALKKCIIKNSETPDMLCEYLDHLQYIVWNFDQEEHQTSDDAEDDSESGDPEYSNDDDNYDIVDPLIMLSGLNRPKMSTYMQKFWKAHGERFFDDKTRQNFLADLKKYRQKLEQAG